MPEQLQNASTINITQWCLCSYTMCRDIPLTLARALHYFRGMHCLYQHSDITICPGCFKKLLILSFFSSSELLSKNPFNKSKFGLSMLSIFVRSSDIWYKSYRTLLCSYVDICDLGAFQKYLTRCARAVFPNSPSITNIYNTASFSIA